jgi:hypothetical protein
VINFLKSFFSYVPPDPLPEVPEEEPSDPNKGKSLSDKYREARRNLVLLAAICIAWSGAQFTIADPTLEVAKITLRFDSASIPVLLCLLLVYLCYRWVFEYSIMERETRRWYPAQIDFRVVSILARFAMLSVCAGALQRSFWTIIMLLGLLGVLALCVVVLSILLTCVTMPIRLWARERAGRTSVANAAFEAVAWASLFAILLTVVGVVALGVMSYRYQPISSILWTTPPSILAYAVFIAVSIFVFLSHWLLRPHLSLLFAARPSYRTYRDEDGRLIYQFGGGVEVSHQTDKPNKPRHDNPS